MSSANQPTVLITCRNFDEAALAHLRDQGCTVRYPGGADPAPDALPGLLEDVDGWIIGGTAVNAELLERFPRLLVLARRGVGYDAIDTAAVQSLGRVLTIAAGGNGPSVADHALGLMLAVSRLLVPYARQMAADDWTMATGLELHKKIVGILGLGRVGRLVARRLRGFDCTVLATDILQDPAYAEANGIRYVDLPTLLRESDIVTLHAPLTQLTRNIVDAAALAAMKRGSMLINTARGGMVDEAALLEALRSGHIAGAGLDVFLAERDPAHRAAAAALAALPNVVATPHAAASTKEGHIRTNMIAARTTAALLHGGSAPADCVVVDGRRARGDSHGA